ncbi:NYN domain-containing protein [Chlorobaculum sp. 24CR]|nr:NYN domain-containing protein [Chlorobaculum sp. 24CR]RXK84709.1 NYN domain-containing protein [Chlorobaculum sp. 24CR]
MEHSRETIAMLIDADNSPSDKIDFILAEMAKYGVVNIRRAYGNWKSHSLKGWEDKLHDYAIRPIQQFDYTKGKNATDMAMTIDGMDLLFSKKLDAFCIVSSDSDFTPLVMRILSEGLNVYGFGQKSTPSPFVNACSTFLYLDSFSGEKEQTKSESCRRKSSHELRSDGKLRTLLLNAVDSAQEEDGWSNLAKIGKNIANQASFDPRNYGYKRLSDLVRSIDMFDIEFRNNHSELYIRDKRKGRKPDALPVEASSAAPVSGEVDPVAAKPVAPQMEERKQAAQEPAPKSVSKPTATAPEAPARKVDAPESSASAPGSAKQAAAKTASSAPAKPEPVAPEVAAAKAANAEPAPEKPVAPEAPASGAQVTESVAELPASTEAKPKRTTRSRAAKPRSTSTRKPRATAATADEAPKLAASPEPEPVPAPAKVVEPEAVPASAETPEPEKKPRRPARRRTTRKKSEGESASAPAEPEG